MSHRALVFVFLLTGLSVLQIGQAEVGSPEVVVIAGTGDSQSLLRSLGEMFKKKHAGKNISVQIPDSVGSSGGIKALIEDRTTLARTARKLKDSEKNYDLKEFPFARSPVVFAVHPSVTGVESLTKQEVIDIYQRKYISWDQLGGPAAPIYPIQRESGDSSRKILEKHINGFVTTSEIKIYYTTPVAAQALAQYKFTIGYLPMSMAKTYNLKILAFDNVKPGEENIINGKYKLVAPFYIVSKGIPQGYAGKFIKFLGSHSARDTIRAFGVVPN